MKLEPKKILGLDRIRTHDLYDTGAELYQLSYQANWELGPFLDSPGNFSGPQSRNKISNLAITEVSRSEFVI